MRRVGCAALCRRLGEVPHGTAPPRGGAWLLIEHPGPWPRAGPPRHVGSETAAVLERAAGRGIRVQLVRRPGARRRTSRQVMVAWTRGGPDEVWLESTELSDPRRLGELDLDAVAAGRRPGFGLEEGGPVLLVCTHGGRDACCAQLGYPVAVALAGEYGPAVWETSHVGGDRFAANVVCLPHGTYHGKVSVQDALAVGAACMRGEVEIANYRGRAGLAPAVQAAEAFARRETGEMGVHAVRVLRHESLDGRARVELQVNGGVLQVEVAARPGPPRTVSCGGRAVGVPVHHELVSIERLTSEEGRLPGADR